MTYTKPYIVPLPDPLSVIKRTPYLAKGEQHAVDFNQAAPQWLTIQAYEGDE